MIGDKFNPDDELPGDIEVNAVDAGVPEEGALVPGLRQCSFVASPVIRGTLADVKRLEAVISNYRHMLLSATAWWINFQRAAAIPLYVDEPLSAEEKKQRKEEKKRIRAERKAAKDRRKGLSELKRAVKNGLTDPALLVQAEPVQEQSAQDQQAAVPQKRAKMQLRPKIAKVIGQTMVSQANSERSTYHLRPYWMEMLNNLVVNQGAPWMGSWIWDVAGEYLASVLSTVMPDYGHATRGCLIAQAILEPPEFKKVGLPIMRTKDRQYAWLMREGSQYLMQIQYGKPEEKVTLVLHGQAEGENGKPYKAYLDDQYKYILRRCMEEADGWRFQTPTIRVERDNGAHFKLLVPYIKPCRYDISKSESNTRYGGGPRITPDELQPGRVCEVVFERIDGKDLPAKKHERETDRLKTFVLHAFVSGNQGIKPRTRHIPVDGVAGYLKHLDIRRLAHETVRDCRRGSPKRFRQSPQEVISRITKKRLNIAMTQNHTWVKDVVFFAVRARCSIIRVFGVPDGKDKGLLLDGTIQWNWSQFMTFLADACRERGVTLDVDTSGSIAAVDAALRETMVKEHEEVEAV